MLGRMGVFERCLHDTGMEWVWNVRYSRNLTLLELNEGQASISALTHCYC